MIAGRPNFKASCAHPVKQCVVLLDPGQHFRSRMLMLKKASAAPVPYTVLIPYSSRFRVSGAQMDEGPALPEWQSCAGINFHHFLRKT